MEACDRTEYGLTISAATRLCAVIGNPVAHSLSPAMHNAAFRAAGLNYVYLAFAVEDVGACLAGMRALGGFRGMSVTIPHKIAIMEYLDEVTPLACQVGCVNTVVNEGGVLTGSITDGHGTLRAFERAGYSIADRSVLFLGAGGAARAVAFAMAATGQPRRIRILGRTPSRAEMLAADVCAATGLDASGGSLEQAGAAARDSDIIIQATPLGMHGHAEGASCVPADALRRGQVVFDMVYRPMETRLLQDAAAAGCDTLPGLEMLLHQAALQFELWTGVAAPEAVMREALLTALRSTA